MSLLTFLVPRGGKPSLRALPAQPLSVVGPRCPDDPSLSLCSFSLASTSLDVCTVVALLLWGHPLAGEDLTYRTSGYTGAGQNCPEGLMQRARCAFFVGLVAISLFSVWVGPAASISLSLMESGPTPFPPSFVGGLRCLHSLRWSRDPLIVDRLSAPPDRASRCGAVRRSRLLRILSRRGGCARNAYRNSARGAKALPLLSLSFFSSLHFVLHVHAFRRLHAFG